MNNKANTALIFDDSAVLVQQLSTLLHKFGIKGTQGNTRGGKHDLPKELPDGSPVASLEECPEGLGVIFVEVLQAGSNGFQLLRSLKRQVHCPLVLVTGSGRVSDVHWGLQAGAAAVLTRPLRLAALESCLKQLGVVGAES